MSAKFEECVRNKGEVKTIKKGQNKYQHICYLNGKQYVGEIKVKKPK